MQRHCKITPLTRWRPHACVASHSCAILTPMWSCAAPQDRHAEAAHYNFFPLTFVVPSEYRMFVEEFKRAGGTWIMKPIGKAQGQGIFLFNKLSQVGWGSER